MNLDTSFGALFFPKFPTKRFSHNRTINTEIESLKLAHYQMDPKETIDAINNKKMLLNEIFEEIKHALEKRKNEPAIELAS